MQGSLTVNIRDDFGNLFSDRFAQGDRYRPLYTGLTVFVKRKV